MLNLPETNEMAVKVREDIGEICEPNMHRQEEQAIRSQPKAVRSG